MPYPKSNFFHLPYNPKLVVRAKMLRRNMTRPEQKLWFQFLKNQPYRFTRQKVIDHYIVDFYSAQLKLVIEIDGNSHFEDEAKRYDELRTHRLEQYGLRVIRFNNAEILKEFEGVCQTLIELFIEITEACP